MKNLKDCLKSLDAMFRPVLARDLVSVCIGLARVAASLAFIWASKALVDIATGALDKPFGLYTGILLGIMAIKVLGNVSANWWEDYNVVLTQNDMRFDTFSHVLRSTWSGREAHHSGDLVNRLEEDVRVVTDLICVRIPDIITTSCQLLAASVYMFILAPKLLWLLLALMVVAVVGSRLFFRTLRKLTQAIREAESKAQQHMQENLQKRVLVLTLIGAEKVLDKLKLVQKDIKGNTISRLNYNAVARAFMGAGFAFGYAATFLWGAYGIRNGVVTFGVMTAFLQLAGQVQRPIADLARHIPAFIHALTSIERLTELTDSPLEACDAPVLIPEAPQIDVNGISFKYEGQQRQIFDKFSCRFEAGRITEVAGPTGIGKSTLIRLILGLLTPSEGEILINGEKVSAGTRCNFMYVPQEGSLLSGTIRDNLLLANPNASEEEMRAALHLAVADFVLDLPDGLDSPCGEDGSGLSEGQCQRIAIARALLCKGSVLLLDESTSALDPQTEEILLNNIQTHCRGARTVIFISHREAVARHSDKVLTINS